METTTVSTPVIVLNDQITNEQMAAMPKQKRSDATMKLRFKITSIKANHKLCNIVVAFQFPGEEEKAELRKNVRISALLNWQLKNNKHPNCMYKVGDVYQSLNLSEDTKANPFQLIQYRDKKTKELKFYLACVFEDNQKVPRTAPDGSTYTEYVDSKRSKTTYRRWRPIRKNK